MAMAYNATTSGSDASVTTRTLTHTATGTALAAVVWLHANNVTGAGSCTYDGAAMVPIAYKQQTTQEITMWALGNVPAGAKNVIATWTNARAIIMGVMTFSGANKSTNPIRASSTSGATGGSQHLSETLASVSGEFCVDAAAGGQSGETITQDGGQTEVYDLAQTTLEGAASYKAATTTTTAIGYTWGGTFQNCIHIGATIAGPPAGNQVIFAMFKQWQDLYDRIRRGLPLPEWYLRRDRPAWAAAYKLALGGCCAD